MLLCSAGHMRFCIVTIELLACGCLVSFATSDAQNWFERPKLLALTPQDSETRETKRLDGIWEFRASPVMDQNIGFREGWFERPLSQTGSVIDMPVPSSYNDITEREQLRDYIGWVWYSRTFFVPESWKLKKVFLRIGSAHYSAIVYVNGKKIMSHSGGHLPFSSEVTSSIEHRSLNFVSIAVNNTLTDLTIPQGELVTKKSSKQFFYPTNFTVLNYNFDFFNYAGIHRPVILYSVPKIYVEDVRVTSEVYEDGTARVIFSVSVNCDEVSVTVVDPLGAIVGTVNDSSGQVKIETPILWWPYLMHEKPGRQHTLEVRASKFGLTDVYRQKFGVRQIRWDKNGIYINGKKIYIKGFGKHEDSDIRGKGLDLPLVVKDYNLIEWIGANCFRTSHYPYAEEIMDMADARGIMVINESPAVALNFQMARNLSKLLEHHVQVLREMITRDRNRPSVIMWSLSNEARTDQQRAKHYYAQLIGAVRALDTTRPISAVLNTDPDKDKVASLLDVICINHYFGWYEDTGSSQLIKTQAFHYFTYWRQKFDLPIINSEYGADTIAGMHMEPAFIFTEEYQVSLMAQNFRAFEALRKQGGFIGEMIWNFADFMTKQQITRVVGNKKGIFTRQRQPKMSAHLLRSRYWYLARDIDQSKALPSDLMFSRQFSGVLPLGCHDLLVVGDGIAFCTDNNLTRSLTRNDLF